MPLEQAKVHKHEHSVEEALAVIRARVNVVPDCAIVLGSGVDALSDLRDVQALSYEDVFGLSPTVAGHAGQLIIGKLPENEKITVVVLRGRYHVYEGHDWSLVTLPTRTLIGWGVPELYLTNAAGGINSDFHVGDLMVMTGYRDLISQQVRADLFSSLKQPIQDCRNKLSERILAAGQKLVESDPGVRPLKQGVYAGFTGPTYETLAEVAMIRKMGWDAVGMSTIPEIQTATGTTLMTAAVSVITNVWSDDTTVGGHEEVLEASKAASLRLDKLFRNILAGSAAK